MKIHFDWGVSSFYGWGVYGLNLALEWSKDPEIEASCTDWRAADVLVDALRRRALRPFARRSGWPADPDAIRLNALGNEILPISAGKIGVAFFEAPLSKAAIERAKRYDLIIAGSSWNARLLGEAGVANVRTILQGVDPTLFHPAPKSGLFADKFLIFSGGKAELRKGQDLVVKAFRIFAQRHADAMLVTAWHSPHRNDSGMDLDLSEYSDRVIDVGAVPNGRMASVYRECDVALFPNRAEGGTNLVAMECLACGVPTILSNGTGHIDICNRPGAFQLTRGKPSALWSEWIDSDVEEIVEALELAYRARWTVGACEGSISDLTWSKTSSKLLNIIKELQ